MGNVTVTLSGDEARILRSIDKVIAKEKALAVAAHKAGQESKKGSDKARRGHQENQQELLKTQREMRKLSRSGQKAFGEQARAGLSKFAVGIGLIAASLAKASEQMARIDAQRQKFASAQSGGELGFRRLAQLGGGDAGKVKQFIEQSKELFSQGGASSQDQASDVIFQLQSAGENTEPNRKLVSQLFGVFSDTTGITRSAKGLQKSLGKAETGSFKEIISKSLAASGGSPALAEDLLVGATKGAPFASQLGIGDEDLLAATAVNATALGGSASEGGTRVQALLKQLNKGKDLGLRKRLRDTAKTGGLDRVLGVLEAEGFANQDKFSAEFGDRAEAFTGLTNLLNNRGDLRKLRAAQSAASQNDLVGKTILSADAADDGVFVSRQARSAKAQAGISGNAIATRKQLANVVSDRIRAHFAEKGDEQNLDTFNDLREGGVTSRLFGLAETDDKVLKRGREQGFLSEKEVQTLDRVEAHLANIAGNTQQGSLSIDPRRDK